MTPSAEPATTQARTANLCVMLALDRVPDHAYRLQPKKCYTKGRPCLPCRSPPQPAPIKLTCIQRLLTSPPATLDSRHTSPSTSSARPSPTALLGLRRCGMAAAYAAAAAGARCSLPLLPAAAAALPLLVDRSRGSLTAGGASRCRQCPAHRGEAGRRVGPARVLRQRRRERRAPPTSRPSLRLHQWLLPMHLRCLRQPGRLTSSQRKSCRQTRTAAGGRGCRFKPIADLSGACRPLWRVAAPASGGFGAGRAAGKGRCQCRCPRVM